MRQKSNALLILLILITATVVLGSIAAINAIVDPFNMYGLYTREGFNAYKPTVHSRVRLLKAYEVRNFKPDSLVLGSSRIHVGMRPSHPGWASLYSKRYNLGFDAATTKEMYAYLVHANAWGNVKQVMLGMEIHKLNDFPADPEKGFDPLLLMNEQTWLNRLRMAAADFKVLTSIGTLKESINTLNAQKSKEPRWLAPDGQRLGEVMFRLPWHEYTKCGPRCYFDEIDKREMQFRLGWEAKHEPDKSVVEVPPEIDPDISFTSDSSLYYIEKIVDYCLQHHIELIVFISPTHAHQLEIFAAVRKWNLLENGKRKLMKLLVEKSKARPDEPPIPLYDFSNYSSITTEALPPLGSRQEMLYYWESSHFKEIVGDMILDRILGTNTPDDLVPPDFGILLTPENIEEVIAADRWKQQEYRQTHADEINMIEGWVRDYKKEHHMVE